MSRTQTAALVLLSLAAWAAAARGQPGVGEAKPFTRAGQAKPFARGAAPPAGAPRHEPVSLTEFRRLPTDRQLEALYLMGRGLPPATDPEAPAPAPPAPAPAPEADRRLKMAEGPPSFAEARRDAIKRGRPLVVWVDYFCGSSAKRLGEMCHWQAEGSEWVNNGRTIEGPSAVVLVPKGDELYLFPDLKVHAHDVCVNSIRGALAKGRARLAGQTQAAAPPTAFAPPPATRAPAWGAAAWGGGGGG